MALWVYAGLRLLRIGSEPALKPDQLVESPLGRKYRTVSKRKVFLINKIYSLGLIDASDENNVKSFDVLQCMIEPDEHTKIFNLIKAKFEKPYSHPLRNVLRYVIIKGNYQEQTLIFSVGEMSHTVSKAVNTLSKSLTHEMPSVVGLFLYEDLSDGRYYLGSKKAAGNQPMKKIFGNPELYQKICGKSFLYHPLSFSQVNQSIVEKMVAAAASLLRLQSGMNLYDLYCGYGLFSLCLADKVKAVYAAELSHESIASAIANAKRQRTENVRFIKTDITEDSIQRIFRQSNPEDAVILDPPRSGTAEGVIESIASKGPKRVLHIFCNIDLMPKELHRWMQSGYTIKKAIPLDNFPGTSTVEVMVLLENKIDN